MRYFKLAMVAGASIVAVAKMSPAYALPAFPLDTNGPIRQGDGCIVPQEPRAWHGLFVDTGPGYDHFEYCGADPRARRTHARHHRNHSTVVSAVLPPQGDQWLRPAVYQRLDTNGPIRQGSMCIVPQVPRAWDGLFVDTGPGYDHFEYCGPDDHHRRHAHGGHHHHRHAHLARHHHRKHHLHHRHHHQHAQYLASLPCDADNGIDTSHDIQQNLQQYLQPSDGADGIDTIASHAIDAAGGIDLASANVASANVAGSEGGGIAMEIQGPQDDGGLLAQLFAADQRPAASVEWTLVATGAQVSHSMMRHAAGERILQVRPGGGERHAPVDPAPSPQHAFGSRAAEPQLRNAAADADQIALTGVGYSSPARSEAGGGMPVTSSDKGYSSIGAVIGLALILAAPIVLVATQLTVADKAAVVETVSDPLAETEWYIPASHPVTLDQRTASAPIKSAGIAAIF